jgi:hypothetical protein
LKDTDYIKIIELANAGGGFIPANERAEELTERTRKGEIIPVIEVTKRDLSFHRCYFSILGMIYKYLPKRFKNQVQEKDFYKFIKHLQGKYKVLYSFSDGTQMVEYESISFGNMTQQRFKDYIAEQMPWIYTEIIGAFFEGEIYDNIIATIEEEYVKFFDRLL